MVVEPPAMVFQNKRLVISEHAIKQFEERWKKHKPKKLLEDPLATLKELLELATEERLDPVASVHRTINNRFQPALYYRFQEWRFVIVEDWHGVPLTLVTAEHNFFSKKNYSRPKKRSRS